MDPDSDLAETEQKIVVFWGEGFEAKILKDIWVLAVSSMTWKEVSWFSFGIHLCTWGDLQSYHTDLPVIGASLCYSVTH